MLGALDPAQFEAEIRNYGLEQGGLGDQLLLRRGGNGNGDEAQSPPQQRQPPGQGGGGGAGEGERERERGGPARKTGKKARRIFDKEERRRRRMGGAGAGGAGGGQGEMWEEDWLSDED